MIDIRFVSEITVKLIQQCGGDHMIVGAAKASTQGERAAEFALSEHAMANAGLIGYLTGNRHGTPSEHGFMTFSVHAPAFVWWEWVRHRVGMTIDCPEMSFNLESGRYKQLEPVFWVPRPDRKVVPATGHKPARPKYEPADEHGYMVLVNDMEDAYRKTWSIYTNMLRNGFANEVARAVLGFGVYYSGWVSCNPRSLMSFLSLRTHDDAAKFPSFPQAEIEEAARACEAVFAEHWPIQYAAFNKYGRVGP